eukprot:GHVT01057679.1.p1 GENE.GHVT01057679.1~~GHVT01057679.1.p1  ORF type:complete len:282 (+),score=25.46 GHVT01057679.1:37-846(+)
MALLIVASVSSPVWNNVGYLKGEIAGRGITFGNWGYCFGGECTGSSLGYPIDFITRLTGTSVASENVLRNLSFTLILTPIAAGLTLIALIFALGTHLILGILGSLAALLAFIVTIVALGLYLGFFIVTRNRVNDLGFPNSHLHLSSCIWLVVAAAGCQLYATITVCFTRSRKRRAAREEDFATVPAMTSTNVYTTTAPSTHESTGPLVHDTTGVNSTYTGNPINENYVDPNYTTTSYPTNTYETNHNTAYNSGADTNSHFWQRKETNVI